MDRSIEVMETMLPNGRTLRIEGGERSEGPRLQSEALPEFLSRAGALLALAVQALRAPRTRAYWD